MSGHVRHRGKSWYFKHERARDPVTGRRRYAEKGGFRTKRDAARAMTESIARMQRGDFVEPERTTLADFLRDWLPGYAMTVRETTAARTGSLIRAQIIPRLGHARLQDLRPRTLEQFYSSLMRGDARFPPVSAATVKSIHGVLSRALSDAERDDRITRNPASTAKPPRVATGSAEVSAWSPAEVQEFLDAMQGHRRYAMWHLFIFTGLRRGEVLGLKWQDVDFDEGSIQVRRQLVAASHHGKLTETKTGSGRRSVDLDASTLLMLRAHRASQSEQRLSLGALWEDHDLIFCSENGSPLLPRTVSAWFRKDVARTRSRRIRLHDLRHTHASMMLQAGVSPKVVQERLGHADVRMTLNTYSHVMPGMQREAVDRLAAMLGG